MSNPEPGESKLWVEEKLKFIEEVFPGVDRHIVRAYLEECETEEEEAVMLVDQFLQVMGAERIEDENSISAESSSENMEDYVCVAPTLSPDQCIDELTSSIALAGKPPPSQEESISHNELIAVASGSPDLAEEENGDNTAQVAQLMTIFPDAHPDYLQERCEELPGELEDLTKLVEELMDKKKTEPRMSGYTDKEKNATKEKYQRHLSLEQGRQEDYLDIDEENTGYQVFECLVCRDDQVLGLNTATCSASYGPHRYCIPCITRYVASRIGEGQTYFKCMDEDCGAEFQDSVLRRVMTRQEYAKNQERRQQEDIRVSGVKNLETCPFCNYSVIMEDPQSNMFLCENPLCLRESCRLCKEATHVPLRCEEVERDHQTKARLQIEEEMSKALIRKCPDCNTNIVGEAGCNKMTCPCGTVMCYICRKKITGYDHFEDSPSPVAKCPLWRDYKILHSSEVRVAAMAAKSVLDPNLKLVHDPTKHIP
ncbi:E3 ubiquitin-protein ligase RNF216 isoform X1 [Cherax quadricarinatus]|uniref:E3 ubiquitin-protein ligase RNF216 isoform X1 n=2 Tax=Cherax quadricarinatus TaxID=27406 RepID=UPI00387EB9CA